MIADLTGSQVELPAALLAFPDLRQKAALTMLAAAPTPTKAATLSRCRVIALLRRSGRGNRPGLADTLVAMFQAPALHHPGGVESAMGLAAAGLVEVIVAMEGAIARLESELHGAFCHTFPAPSPHRQEAFLRRFPLARLALVETRALASGVVVNTYRRSDAG